MLIMSQWSDTRAHVIPSSTSYPQRYLLSDYANTQDWLQAIQNEKKTGGKVIAVEYAVDENTFRDEASKSGFGVDEIKYFQCWSSEGYFFIVCYLQYSGIYYGVAINFFILVNLQSWVFFWDLS